MVEKMSPEQAQSTKTRTIRDAELLKKGAVYLPSGVLSLTDSQLEELIDEHRTEQVYAGKENFTSNAKRRGYREYCGDEYDGHGFLD